MRQSRAIAALKALGEALVSGKQPEQILKQLYDTAQGLDYVAIACYLAATKKQSLLHGNCVLIWIRHIVGSGYNAQQVGLG